jgi:hypothetical protein
MNLDKDDLGVLCEGMTKDEVDRIHRSLHEWNVGPESSFPVQLALLTCAQLRAAASIPRSMADGRKWLERHLAEYRQKTASLVKDFSAASDDKIAVFEETVQKYTETMEKTASVSYGNLAATEQAARQINLELQRTAAESKQELKRLRDDLQEERTHLQKACLELEARTTWREWIQFFLVFVGLVLFGVLIDRLWIQ